MRVAIVGAGSIGSVVAAHLLAASHDVTLVARGERRTALIREGLRVRPRGGRLTTWHVPVVPRLAPDLSADLVIVAVQTQQVQDLLPELKEHPAPTVAFLLNAHRVPSEWSALGERLVLGFPAMLAGTREGVVDYYALPAALRFVMNTTFGPAPGRDEARARELVALFREIGLASVYERDMRSWLGTHTALVTALLSAVYARGARALSWSEAALVAGAMRESFAIVSAQVRITPALLMPLPHLPPPLTAVGLWTLSRSATFQRAAHDYVEHARGELHAMYEDFRASAAASGLSMPCLEQVCAPLAQ